MINRILTLDAKGILPMACENYERYYERGQKLLAAVENYDYIVMAERILEGCGFFGVGSRSFEDKLIIVGDKLIMDCAGKIFDTYQYDLSWAKGFYVIQTASFAELISSFNPSLNEYSIPPTVLIDARCYYPKEGISRDDFLRYFVTHELLHIPREMIEFDDDEDSEEHRFEESFADSIESDIGQVRSMQGKDNKRDKAHGKLLRKAREKLEDKFGDKAGYVLGRLRCDEIKNISKWFANPIKMIESASRFHLRHRIIAEKLGL